MPNPESCRESSFPMKLMNILDSETSDVIVWLPHGRGFVINNKKRLESEILPTYFNHDAKFTSFNRRLKRWEFIVQTHGHKKSSYFHPHFVRHDYASLSKIVPLPQINYSRRITTISSNKKNRTARKGEVQKDKQNLMNKDRTKHAIKGDVQQNKTKCNTTGRHCEYQHAGQENSRDTTDLANKRSRTDTKEDIMTIREQTATLAEKRILYPQLSSHEEVQEEQTAKLAKARILLSKLSHFDPAGHNYHHDDVPFSSMALDAAPSQTGISFSREGGLFQQHGMQRNNFPVDQGNVEHFVPAYSQQQRTNYRMERQNLNMLVASHITNSCAGAGDDQGYYYYDANGSILTRRAASVVGEGAVLLGAPRTSSFPFSGAPPSALPCFPASTVVLVEPVTRPRPATFYHGNPEQQQERPHHHVTIPSFSSAWDRRARLLISYDEDPCYYSAAVNPAGGSAISYTSAPAPARLPPPTLLVEGGNIRRMASADKAARRMLTNSSNNCNINNYHNQQEYYYRYSSPP